VTPGDRVLHRLQPQRSVAAPARQQRQPPFQPLPQRRQRQVGEARRGELDRQGHAVQAATNVRDQCRVVVRHRERWIHRLAALGEQLHRRRRLPSASRPRWRCPPPACVRHGQWRNRESMLAGHPQ
jgi:hypothetical protein